MSRDGLKALAARIARLMAEYYRAPVRREAARARRELDELLLMLVFAEALGVPNPVHYHLLELTPLLLERFHHWHRRAGIDRSPLEGLRCC